MVLSLSKQQSAPIVVRPFFSLDQIETSSFPARYTKWHWLACGSPIRKLPSCQPVRPPLSRSVQRGSFPHRHGGTSTLTLKEFLTDAMPMPQARFARARSKPLLVAPDAGRPQKPLYTTSRPLHNDLLLGGEHLFWLLHLLSRARSSSRGGSRPPSASPCTVARRSCSARHSATSPALAARRATLTTSVIPASAPRSMQGTRTRACTSV